MTTQDIAYAQKLAELAPLYTQIFTSVKKDMRDEHLKMDRGFFKRNFPNRDLNSLTVDDLIQVYSKFITAGSEPLAEFIANRWLLRHLEIYNYFEEKLQAVSSKIDEIQELEEGFARRLLEEATSRFSAQDCYIFSILNCVAFPKPLLNTLRKDAIQTAAAT